MRKDETATFELMMRLTRTALGNIPESELRRTPPALIAAQSINRSPCVVIRPEHRKTFPRGRIPETLLMFIRLRGGASAEVNSEFVYSPLADFYELSEDDRRLSLADYYTSESGPGLAWNSEVNAAVKGLRKDGYLTVGARSGKYAWRLTPTGLERADFWLKRMTEKRAALSALKVDTNLPSLHREQESSFTAAK